MSALLHAEPPTRLVVGVDLGGTKTAAAVVGPPDHVRTVVTAPTPALAGAEAIIECVLAMVHEAVGQAGVTLHEVAGIGVGTAGVVDPSDGSIASATDHLAGWTGTPLAARLAAETGRPVRVVNDVHAHAVGESIFGAGRGQGSMLLVAAGTGLGGAVVVDGAVLIGRRGIAGHLGHVACAEAAGLQCACGASGHLESLASGTGLAGLYARRGGGPISGAEVAARAAGGDDLARDCLTESGRALGAAIGGWINVLDPDLVVITGGLARAGTMWWQAVTEAAGREVVAAGGPPPITHAVREGHSGLLGAACLAPVDSTPRSRP